MTSRITTIAHLQWRLRSGEDSRTLATRRPREQRNFAPGLAGRTDTMWSPALLSIWPNAMHAVGRAGNYVPYATSLALVGWPDQVSVAGSGSWAALEGCWNAKPSMPTLWPGGVRHWNVVVQRPWSCELVCQAANDSCKNTGAYLWP